MILLKLAEDLSSLTCLALLPDRVVQIFHKEENYTVLVSDWECFTFFRCLL